MSFLQQIVFGSGGSATSGKPNPRFSYLLPTAGAALIQVRLRAGLTDAQQARAISLIRAAVAMPQFRLGGGSYLVSGEPVLLSDLGAGISHQLVLLLIAAAIVMAVVLLVGFRARPRMLPLLLALAAAAVTFGLTALVGASLTLAGVAVLPILIGLGVDYAVQYQSGTPLRAVAVAACATAAGFLVLLLSPVPMVQGFGLLLVIGVGVALAMVVLAVPAVLAQTGTSAPELPVMAARHGRVTPAVRLLTTRSRGVLAVAVVLAAAGWGLGTQTSVQSDITKLVPSKMPALENLDKLEQITGVSGEIDVVVHAHNVATPRAVAWMVAYERKIVAHFGYSAGRGCASATICPALSLPDLFQLGSSGNTALTRESIDALLSTVPGYFQRAVITPDRHYATLAFGIRLMPLTEQRAVVSYMRRGVYTRHPVSVPSWRACRCSRRMPTALSPRCHGGC